jgi:hypothetical protein
MLDEPIGAGSDLLGRLSTGRTVAIEVPVGSFTMNIHSQASFIAAIVPFRKVWIDLGIFGKSRQFTGSTNANERACKYPGESLSFESGTQKAGVLFPAGVQRNICTAGMFARV